MTSMDGCGRVFDNIFVERLCRSVKCEDVYLSRRDPFEKDYQIPEEAYRGMEGYFEFYPAGLPFRDIRIRPLKTILF